ncbi:erythromycin esterase family protein [Priestia megaterium]|uniref:erythromycin esterase family protein n=1 Tax=Priestia megaterium TaxID=1404 RepID=UPI0028629128|nr:erythromycin esterase family protein [Priestia megaterium]MDR7246527.1 erythromycin esterase [Priestia megaterium]
MKSKLLSIITVTIIIFSLSSLSTTTIAMADGLKTSSHPIKKTYISENDNFNDLRFLKPLLKDKKIVMLGENSHGVAEYNSTKSRLINYLHEELGFNIIVFESGLAEAYSSYYSNNNPTDMMKDGIYPVWHSKEILPLFKYISKEKDSTSPLILSGMDPLPGNGFTYFVKQVFDKYNIQNFNTFSHLESEYKYLVYQETSTSKFQTKKDNLIQDYKEILKEVVTNKDKFSEKDVKHYLLITHVIEERIEMLETNVEFFIKANKKMQEGNYTAPEKLQENPNYIRDVAMAKQIEWITNNLYPNQKIIVWGHNYHLRKNNSEVQYASQNYGIPSMGELLSKDLKQKAYTIGLYMKEGEQIVQNQLVPVPNNHPIDSVENILSQLKTPVTFIDMVKVKNKNQNKWMYTRSSASDFGVNPEFMIPRNQYDGILFFQKVHAPTLLNNNR